MSAPLVALGAGTDGTVWLSGELTAIKAFRLVEQFEVEKECYLRLAAQNVTEVRGFVVPRMVDCNSKLQVIEMSVVQAPYILNFGKCYLDAPPRFTPEVWQDLEDQIREMYDDRYDEVMAAVRSLQRFGIYYYDVKPKNVLPANWNPTV